MELILGLCLVLVWVHARNTRRGSTTLADDVRKALDTIDELRSRVAALERSHARQIGETAPTSETTAVALAPAAPLGETRAPAPALSTEAAAAAPPAPAVSINPAPRQPATEAAPHSLSLPSLERPATAPAPAIEWLLRGNPLAKLGVVLLFFGLAYLLRFATERGLLPIEVRLAGAAAISLGLLAVGWRLRRQKPVYALTLQGGAIGALYLTSFAAFRLYGLLPSAVVFALLVVICAASVALAVLQNAQSLAVLASLGGYLAPVLLSTGGGSHVALFGYYALLSIGILAITIRRAWSPLNLVGFAFTFGIGTLWGLDHYTPSLYVSCQLFLALNVAIYGVLAVLTAVGPAGASGDARVDGTLTFGTAVAGFGLQVGLTQHWTYGPAFSALAFGALYLPLARFVLRQWPEQGRRLAISFLALGGGFVTLAIPLALSAKFTAMAWALEGVGILWAGREQRNARMLWSGTGLLVLAAGSACVAWAEGLDTPTFLLAGSTLSLAWLGGAWLWRTSESGDGQTDISRLLFAGAIAVWLVVVVGASERLTIDDRNATALALFLMTLSALVWHVAGRQWSWAALSEAAFLLVPFMALVMAGQLNIGQQPFGGLASLGAWTASFVAAWHLLRQARPASPSNREALLHILTWWVGLAVVLTEAWDRLVQLSWGSTEWRVAGLLTICAAFALWISVLRQRRHWATDRYPRAYLLGAVAPAWALAAVLLVVGNLLDGRAPDLRYVPLLNPIEESAAFALMTAVLWRRRLDAVVDARTRGAIAMTIVAFAAWWCNGMLLRTFASVGGVPWAMDALWRSAFLQAAMAIAWTLVAVISMATAARRGLRGVWFAGAVLLGAVVAKLFLVDSAYSGGLGRAVAFIGVALLILAIGYLAPLPPRTPPTEGSTT